MLKRLLTGSAVWLFLLFTSIVLPPSLTAQVALDEAQRVDLVLDDGTNVTLMGAAKGLTDQSTAADYYYLPTGLRLATGPDGRPQFMFLKYNTETGDVQGGILHFLMEWGLTQDQLEEAGDKLRDVCTEGAGPRTVEPAPLEDYLQADVAAARERVLDAREDARDRMANSPGQAGGVLRTIRHHSNTYGLLENTGAIPCGEVRGAARVTADGQGESFRVISATLTSDAMSRNLVSSGKAPVLPGNRIAVAADLNANGAQLLAAPFEKDMPIGDLSLELDMAFTSRVPAAEGMIVMHWDRLQEQAETLSREWNKRKRVREERPKRCFLGIGKPFCDPNKTVSRVKNYKSDIEIREDYEFLIEHNIIELNFSENVEDDRLAAVREAFFNYFVSAFTEPISAQDMPAVREQDGASEEFTIDQGSRRYYRAKSSLSSAQMTRSDTFRLNYNLAYERPFSVVQNIKSWYDDIATNHPEAMAQVNLNDPFFRNRTIRFRLDFDAPQELFSRGEDRDAAINYVTVQMRKQRDAPGENDFTDYITIDESYIAENGLFAEMTFAEGGADDAETFEYMTQWSYGGGHLYPESPRWTRGNSPAITLAPPVAPRTIEVEGDLSSMEASDVARINVQVAYRKFGEAFVTNIPVSPAAGQPLVSRTLFMDRDQNGYAYRLIVYQKTGDRIATDWSPKVNDDYVFAAVPSDILQSPDLLEQAKAAASNAAGQAVQSAANEALERFESVLGGG